MSAHDDAKKKILARRASFVAAALAGIGTACGKEPGITSQSGLSQPMVRDDAAAPKPCLTPVYRPDSEEHRPLPDAGATEDDGPSPPPPSLPVGDAGARPRPCLKIVPPQSTPGTPPPAPPRPCLSPRRDRLK